MTFPDCAESYTNHDTMERVSWIVTLIDNQYMYQLCLWSRFVPTIQGVMILVVEVPGALVRELKSNILYNDTLERYLATKLDPSSDLKAWSDSDLFLKSFSKCHERDCVFVANRMNYCSLTSTIVILLSYHLGTISLVHQ